jgi:hypothetical protein
LMQALGPLMPPPSSGAPSGHPRFLSEPGALVAVLKRAGLRVLEQSEVPVPLYSPALKPRGARVPALAPTNGPSHTAERLRFAPSLRMPTALTRDRSGSSATRMSSFRRQVSNRSSHHTRARRRMMG